MHGDSAKIRGEEVSEGSTWGLTPISSRRWGHRPVIYWGGVGAVVQG